MGSGHGPHTEPLLLLLHVQAANVTQQQWQLKYRLCTCQRLTLKDSVQIDSNRTNDMDQPACWRIRNHDQFGGCNSNLWTLGTLAEASCPDFDLPPASEYWGTATLAKSARMFSLTSSHVHCDCSLGAAYVSGQMLSNQESLL